MSQNPRAFPPGQDPNLHPNPAPECSLVESLGEVADDIRQMFTDFGLRPYQVWSVVVRWSGGERHRGSASVRWQEQFLPTPKVANISRVAKELRAAGDVERGDVRVTQISPRYTEDDILRLFPRELGPGEEHFLEVRHDQRDGSTERRRYIVSALPERRAEKFDWEVQLTKQEENRTRGGSPR